MLISKRVSVFVLNLERDLSRREHMRQMLSGLNIDAEFVPAIDGKTLTEQDLAVCDKKKTLRVYGKEMLPGEIGCYLSHYRIYEHMLKESLPYALIFEDDIQINSSLPGIINELVAEPDHEWLIVRLDSTRSEVLEAKSSKFKGQAVKVMDGGTLYRLNTHTLGLYAYLISLKGAKRMLEYGRDIFMPIDQTMDRFWENEIQPYIVRPSPAQQQKQFETSIGLRPPSRKKSQPLSQYLQRRLQRIADSIAKRWYTLKRLSEQR